VETIVVGLAQVVFSAGSRILPLIGLARFYLRRARAIFFVQHCSSMTGLRNWFAIGVAWAFFVFAAAKGSLFSLNCELGSCVCNSALGPKEQKPPARQLPLGLILRSFLLEFGFRCFLLGFCASFFV
jgi:hypothetical protein